MAFYLCSAGSKLTAGIHKIADTLTKTAKKKSFDKQDTPENLNETDGTSPKPPVERKVSLDDKVSYVDRQSSAENLLDRDEESIKGDPVVGVHNGGSTNDEGQQVDDYLEVVREPTTEEQEIELKVQQKIEALKRGEESSQPVSILLCSCMYFVCCGFLLCSRRHGFLYEENESRNQTKKN